MKLKIIVSAIFVLLTAAKLSAQQYQYAYDYAGNKISVILYKSTEATSDPNPIIEKTGNVEFKLFPNPTRGEITIETSGIKRGTKMTFYMWNETGILLMQQSVIDDITINSNMSNRPNGLYILRLQYGDDQKTWHVLKQ